MRYANEWNDSGVFDGGHVGGDFQVGEAWTKRLTRRLEDGTYKVVDISYYPVTTPMGADLEGATGFGVDEQVEYLLCESLDDPGGTEITSDVEYDVGWSGQILPTVKRAEEIAKFLAMKFQSDDLYWYDG